MKFCSVRVLTFSRRTALGAAAALCLGIPIFCGSRVLADDQVPPVWSGIDIGAAAPAGGATSSGGSFFTLSGGGAGIGDMADMFHYVYQGVTGDFMLTAHLSPAASGHAPAETGLMVREELADNSNFVGVFLNANNAAQYTVRSNYAPLTSMMPSASASGNASWLKLVKQGTTVRAYTADGDGTGPGPWHLVGQCSPTPTEMVFAGPFIASGSQGATTTAAFDHIVLTTGPQPLQDAAYSLSPYNAPNLALDGSGGGSTPVGIAPPASGAAQAWTVMSNGDGYYSIRPTNNPAQALTVSDTGGKDGTKIIMAQYQGQDTQLWKITPNGSYFNIDSKQTPASGIDNFGGSMQPGGSVDLWADNGYDPHLEWQLSPAAQ